MVDHEGKKSFVEASLNVFCEKRVSSVIPFKSTDG